MRRPLVTVLFLVLVPRLGFARGNAGSWDDLKQLRVGEKIEVVDMNLKSVKGTFLSFSPDSISLNSGKQEMAVQRADVMRVSVRDTSKRTRNMLLGSGILGGVALAAAAVPLGSSSNEGNSCGVCVVAIVAGFGGGAALGALPGSRTVYRAEKQRSRPQP